MRAPAQKLWRPLGSARRASLALLAALCAAAVPGKVADPVVVLAQVRRDWNAGKHDTALARLAELEESDLADHVALIRAGILREQGRVEDSIAAARRGLQRDPPSEVESRLHHQIAQLALEQGDALAGYREQRRAWESSRDPEHSAALLMELAVFFDGKQRPGDALRLYRQVWLKWPLSEVSEAAFERSAVLTVATGAPAPSARRLLEYADGLRASARCERALPTYGEVLARSDLDEDKRAEAGRGRAHCLFKQRRYPEAVRAFEVIAEADPEDDEARIRIARSLARAGQTDRAIQRFESIAKSGNAATRARARYLSAVLLQDQKPARAEALFRGVEKQRAVPELARAARWTLAWENVMRGEHRIAVKRLAPLARGSQWDVEVQRARYWRAMATREVDAQAGREALRSLAEALPLSYYGLIAADRLGERPRLEYSFVGQRMAGSEKRRAAARGGLLRARDVRDRELAARGRPARSGLPRRRRPAAPHAGGALSGCADRGRRLRGRAGAGHRPGLARGLAAGLAARL